MDAFIHIFSVTILWLGNYGATFGNMHTVGVTFFS